MSQLSTYVMRYRDDYPYGSALRRRLSGTRGHLRGLGGVDDLRHRRRLLPALRPPAQRGRARLGRRAVRCRQHAHRRRDRLRPLRLRGRHLRAHRPREPVAATRLRRHRRARCRAPRADGQRPLAADGEPTRARSHAKLGLPRAPLELSVGPAVPGRLRRQRQHLGLRAAAPQQLQEPRDCRRAADGAQREPAPRHGDDRAVRARSTRATSAPRRIARRRPICSAG